MFTLIVHFVCVYSSIINIMFLFFKKFSTQLNSFFNILFFCYEEVECATSHLNFINDIILFFCSFSIIWTFFVISCKIVFINYCLRALIYVFKNILTFRLRNECVSKQLTLKFCLTYLITLLIYKTTTLNNSRFSQHYCKDFLKI